MRRLGIWALCVVVFLGAGTLAGTLLDASLWRVSYDYVYRPHQFTAAGLRWGGLLGTIAAAAATLGARPATRRQDCARACLFVVLTSLGGAVVSAGMGAAIIKLQLFAPLNDRLIPTARVWFCEGLWRGAAVGSGLGLAWACWRLWGRRKVAKSPS